MNSSRDQTVLTEEGRKRLTERARRLRDETIPALISAIEAAEQDASLQMELDLAANELQRLTYLLETAGSTDAIPEDPDVVQVGDWVTIVSEDDGSSRYLIVHPAEAGVDVDRVSSESPLAKAVLGHRVGDEVEVHAPTKRYAVTIAEVLRERSGS